jgi:hypothetical protein
MFHVVKKLDKYVVIKLMEDFHTWIKENDI